MLVTKNGETKSITNFLTLSMTGSDWTLTAQINEGPMYNETAFHGRYGGRAKVEFQTQDHIRDIEIMTYQCFNLEAFCRTVINASKNGFFNIGSAHILKEHIMNMPEKGHIRAFKFMDRWHEIVPGTVDEKPEPF